MHNGSDIRDKQQLINTYLPFLGISVHILDTIKLSKTFKFLTILTSVQCSMSAGLQFCKDGKVSHFYITRAV